MQSYFHQVLMRLATVRRSRSQHCITLAAVRRGFAFALVLLLAQPLAPLTLHAQFAPQRPILDSLHKRLAAARGDSAKIQALCELSSAYTNYENDRITAEQYARQALERARRTKRERAAR